MKPNRRYLRLALAVAVLTTGATAQAELVYLPYSASENVAGEISSAVTTLAARSTFLGELAPGAKTETFEGFDTSSGAINAGGLSLFGDSKAGIQPSANGEVTNVIDAGGGSLTGRFNTTGTCDPVAGCNFLETAFGFTLAFGGDYSAFAFFGTDFSDFAGTISIDLLETDANGNLVVVSGAEGIVVSSGTGTSGDGSLLHFGWTDSSRSYAGMRFNVVQSGSSPLDFLGFDDMVLGNFKGTVEPPPTGMPEPGSLALVALSLAGLALTRRSTLRG